MKKAKMKIVIENQRDIIASQKEIIEAHHTDFLKIKDLSDIEGTDYSDVGGLTTLLKSIFKIVDR